MNYAMNHVMLSHMTSLLYVCGIDLAQILHASHMQVADFKSLYYNYFKLTNGLFISNSQKLYKYVLINLP